MSRSAVLALLGVTLLAGCNVFEPFYGDSSRVEDMLDDARFARAAGDFVRAEQILRNALEREPANQKVRLELSSTLSQKQGINILDVERVLNHLEGKLSGSGSSLAGRGSASVCTFGADASLEPFDPDDIEDYSEITEAYPVLQEILALLTEPGSLPGGAPAMPPAFGNLTTCSVITGSGIVYDRPAVRQALRNHFGTNEAVTGALSLTATSAILTAYVGLFQQPDIAVEWFVVDGNQLGACVPEAQYDEMVLRARQKIDLVGRAIIALDMLMFHTGNSDYQEFVDDAVEYFDAFQGSDFYPCGR